MQRNKNMIQQDKILHFLIGFAIATVLQFMGVWMLLPVLAIGAGKELYDKYIKKTTFDVVDLVCTFAGGYFGYWVFLIYQVL